MSKIKLVYFDFSGSRGEECRLALHVAGVPFEDVRLGREAWAQRKPTTPFGSLPVLEVEGLGTLAQSNAILRYVGRTYGLHPADAWEAARHDAVMDAAEDLRHQVSPTMRIKDEDEKKRAREELAAGYLQTWGANLDKQIKGRFVGGDTINVADIKLSVLINWFVKGTLDHIAPNVFERHTKLMAAFEAVKNHPKVVEWHAR